MSRLRDVIRFWARTEIALALAILVIGLSASLLH
jgi:hypothetical protein